MVVRLAGFVVLVVVLAIVVLLVLRVRDGLAGGRAAVPGRPDAQSGGPGDGSAHGSPNSSLKRPTRGGAAGSTPEARHTQALSVARRRLREAEDAHRRAVREARDRLADASRDIEVMALREDVWLGRVSLVVDGREHPLTQATTFASEVSGRIDYLTRKVGQELKIVPEDRRQGRLVVEDPTWHERVDLTPDLLERTEQFVAAGEAAVEALAEGREDRDQRVAAAQERLDRVEADTEQLDLARMTVEDLEGAGPGRSDLPPAPDGSPDDDGNHNANDDLN